MAKKDEKKGPWWRKYTREYAEEEPKQSEPPAKPVKRPAMPAPGHRDPFAELENIQRRMLRGDFFRNREPRLLKMDEGLFRRPLVQVRQTSKDVIVRVEMPGVRKEDVKIQVVGQDLIIDAQSRRQKKEEKEGFYGASSSYKGYRNVIRLPAAVDKGSARAKYEEGVLTVVLPKAETGEGPSNIEIE